jgi:hypothetical protein
MSLFAMVVSWIIRSSELPRNLILAALLKFINPVVNWRKYNSTGHIKNNGEIHLNSQLLKEANFMESVYFIFIYQRPSIARACWQIYFWECLQTVNLAFQRVLRSKTAPIKRFISIQLTRSNTVFRERRQSLSSSSMKLYHPWYRKQDISARHPNAPQEPSISIASQCSIGTTLLFSEPEVEFCKTVLIQTYHWFWMALFLPQ